MPEQTIIRIELTPKAKQLLDEHCAINGRTRVVVVARLLEWVMNQSPTVQAAVLGCFPPEIEAEVAKIILKQMDR